MTVAIFLICGIAYLLMLSLNYIIEAIYDAAKCIYNHIYPDRKEYRERELQKLKISVYQMIMTDLKLQKKI